MAPVVATSGGKVEGLTKDGIDAFRGIPFAATTAGAGRFRAPQPVEGWAGTRDATVFGPPAPQVVSDGLMGQSVFGQWSEDCLNLNLWTSGCDDAARPVMVWVHGGSFVSGSGATALYTGSRLARRGDVVVVTFNYRLGALGYLAHPDLADEDTGAVGNFGLLDQLAALRWVQDNVAAFGGDPGNVTLFGESAGGMSVSTLLSMDATSGLFRRAVAQSGPPLSATRDDAATVAELIAATAGVAVADLRSLRADAVIAAQGAAFTGLVAETGVPFKPVVDGTVLEREPLESIIGGARADAPLIVGTNRDESKLWLAMFPELMQVDEGTLGQRLADSLPAFVDRLPGAVDLYQRERTARGESTSPIELLAAVSTDAFFLSNVTKMAEAHAAHQPATYSYLFTHESPMLGGLLGSCHALEIPFVFGTHNLRGADLFCSAGPEVERLSADMQDAWIAFARTGDPSTPGLEWPAYEAGRRATMVFGTKESVIEDAPLETERRYWATSGTE
jgi:para-nitrobenzyl esterase